MEKSATEPVEPSKPPEIDPELTASAATAVEQWRNYQQAYAAYQQQYAAYQQYIQQTQFAQTVEQQQMAYSQYLEQHRQYQFQLQQYEQHKQLRQNGVPAGNYEPNASGWPQAPGIPALVDPGSMIVQQPIAPLAQPGRDAANGFQPGGTDGRFAKATNPRRQSREPRSKFRGQEKKSELHTKTTIYVNPEDESLLPEDLKKLFKELQCDLCRTRMNSHISANIHYQSKSHEKKINQWLKEYCTQTGTPMPVRTRRQLELVADANVVGRSVLHCEACDLQLTSIQHANQHYTGRRHYMVVNGKKVPSGNGYYNADGKWIRSGNLAVDKVVIPEAAGTKRPIQQPTQVNSTSAGTGEVKRLRLEPPPELPKELVVANSGWPLEEVSITMTGQPPSGLQPIAGGIIDPPAILTITVDSDEDVPDMSAGAVSTAAGVAAPLVPPPTVASVAPVVGPLLEKKPTTLEQEIRKKEGLDCVDDTGTFCLICETSVTSRSEMLMHLKGAKHIKKARTMGMLVRTTPFNPSDTILKSVTKPVRQTDWSLYRMPSGKFYCKTCNLIVADEKLFGQHWYGKKHKLKMRQEQTAQKNGTVVPVPVMAIGTNGDTAAVPELEAGTSVTPVDAAVATGATKNALPFKPPTVNGGKRGWKRPHFFGKKGQHFNNKPKRQFQV
ncbi:uncharacterized protein LOC128278026 [Anopheles cruzii]|uniref:uncharacterized protein LOC128278026 n=1 Tax=Anopheles cruzii TaxID=68878 RepID=UPI0022EC7417|nr:uncharacterized protein LOC128278026 [Anopheles cruzii]